MSHIIFPINAEPLGKVPPNPSQACPGSQREGGRQGAAGHLLGVVVVVVVDVDGGCDAADDERDATGDQVEPARGEGGRCSPRHRDTGTRAGQQLLDRQELILPSPGVPACGRGLGLGQGDVGTGAWAEGPAAPRPHPAAGAPSRSPPCTGPEPSPPSTAAWTGRSSAK